ncbi:probable glutamate receptor isoform X2 [Centruroides sculpturatus]|nr:probable glutamate receptor isoform X2 [Centruroides sculpturatus]
MKGDIQFQIFQVRAKFADIMAEPIALSNKTFQRVDFSTVSDVEPIHFYMKRHKKKLTWQSVLNPFTKQVWLALIFTITIFGLIFRKFVTDNKGEPWTLRRTYWYLMTTLMYQGVDSNNVNRLSSRIAFGIWLLMTAVLIWGYAGILTSFMAVQTDEPVPNTFDELAEAIKRQEYTCVVLPHAYINRYLKESGTKHARLFVTESEKHIFVMNAKVRQNATLMKKFFKDYVDSKAKSHREAKAFKNKLFTDILIKDRMVVIGTFFAENLVAIAYGSNYVKSDDVLSTVYKGFAMRKGFPYKKQVNKLIRRIFETKIFKIEEVLNVPSFEDAAKPLSVADLYGALGILVIGYTLSFACFLTEIILGKFLK